MPAIDYDITIEQGTEFNLRMALKERDDNDALVPKNLTGYTGKAQIRKRPGGKLLAEFAVSIPVPATDGIVLLDLTEAETIAIPAGTFLYDCELDSGTKITKLVRGIATVIAEITKEEAPA